MQDQQALVRRIFNLQGENGCWKMIPESNKYYPDYLHYVPNFKATLWVLILLADIGHDKNDKRIIKPLRIIKDQFYDSENKIYSLKSDHFPIPCLNGNLIYLDSYFNGYLSDRSLNTLDFFCQFQRFDDGEYIDEKTKYCKNSSCYGKHSCYWGVVKLLKGVSFIPEEERTKEVKGFLEKCINYVLLHKVCYSSHISNKIMIKKIDKLTFPNMYKSDYLEILWLLKREAVHSDKIVQAVELLRSKKLESGDWNLEKKVNNLISSVGEVNKPNKYVTSRAKEVLKYYSS